MNRLEKICGVAIVLYVATVITVMSMFTSSFVVEAIEAPVRDDVYQRELRVTTEIVPLICYEEVDWGEQFVWEQTYPVEVDKKWYTEADIVMLAKVMWGEARGIESDTEKACICWTILNRVDLEGKYADDICSVVTAPNQFFYEDWFPVDDHLYQLASDVLFRWNKEKNGAEDVGRVLQKDFMWYSGFDGHNWFRNAYRGGDIWDYSLESPYES